MKIVRTERYWGIVPAKKRIVLFPGYVEEIELPSADGRRVLKKIVVEGEGTVRYHEDVPGASYKDQETSRIRPASMPQERLLTGREINRARIRGRGKFMGSTTVVSIKYKR